LQGGRLCLGPGVFRRMFSMSWFLVSWSLVSTFDFSVPLSNSPKLVYDTKQDQQATGITGAIVGHVGDGKYS
jgi:hypothetical protein